MIEALFAAACCVVDVVALPIFFDATFAASCNVVIESLAYLEVVE